MVVVVIVPGLQPPGIVWIEFSELLGAGPLAVTQFLAGRLALGSHRLVGLLRHLGHPALEALPLGEGELVALEERIPGDR